MSPLTLNAPGSPIDARRANLPDHTEKNAPTTTNIIDALVTEATQPHHRRRRLTALSRKQRRS
jgi:hypothetical protein